jgi:predicted transcriptional regulator
MIKSADGKAKFDILPEGIVLVKNEGIKTKDIKAAAVGRRLGISQSLMAQYINGTKKPSKERERMIMDEIATIASELQSICA